MKNLKILDKYILSQVVGVTIVCILLFSIIWIAPEILLRTVQRVLNGTYTLEMGISAILCEIPKILANALPIGVFLGTLFTFDKLSKDSEIYIFRATGVSFSRMIAACLVFGAIVGGLTFFVKDRVIPYASMKYDIVKRANPVVHFVFPVTNEDGSMNRVIIVPEYRNHNVKDVVVLNFASKSDGQGQSILNDVYMGDFVRFNDNRWIINDAVRYKIASDGIYTRTGTYKNLEILNGIKAAHAYELMKASTMRERDMTNKTLKNVIRLMKEEGMDDEYRFMTNKYLQRFSGALMSMLFVILGALLGFSKPREQRLIGFTGAILTIFLYYITMPFLDLLSEKGFLPPLLSAFLPAIAVITAIYFIKRHKGL